MPGTERRKTVFLTALLLALIGWAVAWLTQQDADPYLALTSPVVLAYLVGAVWLILRHPAKLQLVERFTYWFFLVEWLGAIATGSMGTSTALSLVMLLVFAYLVFSTTTALRAGLVAIVAETAIGFSRFILNLSEHGRVQELGMFAENTLFLSVILLFLHTLARDKDDYTAAQVEAERLRAAAYRDVLTGLRNRRRLEERLDQQIATAQRHERPLSLILFDLDNFKDVNDTLGHEAGDEVLQEVAAVIKPLLRTGDILGRWGGEEFLIIAPETDAAQARALAERLRERIEQHGFPRGRRVTASFGVAGRTKGETPKEMLRLADEALYDAKRAGRNRTALLEAS